MAYIGDLRSFSIRVLCTSGPIVFIPDEEVGNHPRDHIREWRFDYVNPSKELVADISAEAVEFSNKSEDPRFDKASEVRLAFNRVLLVVCLKQWNMTDTMYRVVPVTDAAINGLDPSVSVAVVGKILAGIDENPYGPPCWVAPEHRTASPPV